MSANEIPIDVIPVDDKSDNVTEDLSKSKSKKRVLYIMRGPPGCGKTTWCRRTLEKIMGLENKFLDEHPKLALSHILSADNYYMNRGKYYFNASKLPEYHKYNFIRTEGSMILNLEPIFVDNSNTRVWEFSKYVRLAKKYKYWIKIIEPTEYNEDAFDLDKLIEINKKRDNIRKNINEQTLKNHIERYQKEYKFFT